MFKSSLVRPVTGRFNRCSIAVGASDRSKKKCKQAKHLSMVDPPKPKTISRLSMPNLRLNNININEFQNPETTERLRTAKKLDFLLSKINDMPDESNATRLKSERIFRKNISKNLESLVMKDSNELKEQNDIIKDYSSSVKANMYTMTKIGIKYRSANLKKRLNRFPNGKK